MRRPGATETVRPPRLRPGSRVALVAPAGPVTEEAIDAALRRCEGFGFEAVLAPGARARHGYLAGPDDNRLADLQRVIGDPSIDGIWALRGGYGSTRILDRIDPGPLVSRPKAFIGFSDNTAVHARLGAAGLITFHGPHAGNSFPGFTEASFRRVVMTAEAAGVLPAPDAEEGSAIATLAGGSAEGRLAGGNLMLLAGLCGTPWAPDLRDRILVVEDVGEAAYRVDRAWTQLRLAGCLEGVRGVVLGQFTNRPVQPDERPFDQVLLELVGPLGVPTIAGAPVGHIDHQWTLPLGALARLDADARTLSVLEPAVR